MNFIPLSDEELQIAALLPEGTYSYKVIKSEDKVSQAGNDYVKITLKVWDNEGKEHFVFTNMALIKLLKHFCDVNLMHQEYLSGNIPAMNFLDKSGGFVVIGIEGEKPDGKGGVYKSKNIVKDYISDSNTSRLTPLGIIKTEEFINDELLF